MQHDPLCYFRILVGLYQIRIFDKFQKFFNYKEGIRLRVVGTGRLRQYGLHIDTAHFNTTPLSQIQSINFSSETTIVMDIICCTAERCV